MNDTPENRRNYIDAITKLLEKADIKNLRIIWIVVSGLTK